MALTDLGWDAFFEEAFKALDDARLHPARVAVEHRGGYVLWSETGEWTAELSGKLRHASASPSQRPKVGDWVAAKLGPTPDSRHAFIQAVLPRRTCFSRTTAGKRADQQVLAANIDVTFLVAALSHPLNLRSLERYLAMTWESGAQPVIVLTKMDLCQDVRASVDLAQSIAGNTTVLPVCGLTGHGISSLQTCLNPGQTAAVLGPSGVGKSTLINFWCGRPMEPTQPVRESDQKGRHTTTQRHLIRLPSGALIIDTPGLRELQLWEGAEGMESTFDDIASLATQCRFTNCRHESEPGCAVKEALDNGSLDPQRLASHRKLQRELGRAESKHDKRAQAEEKRRTRGSTRYHRSTLKQKKR